MLRQITILVLFAMLLGLSVPAMAQKAPSPEDEEVIREEMTAGEEVIPETKRQKIVTAPEEKTSATEEWIQKTKNPTDWLSWGADLRLRTIYDNNIVLLNKHANNHERFWQRYRTRAWFKIAPWHEGPMKGLELNTRLVWEFRNWCKPKGTQKTPTTAADHLRSTDGDEVIIDQLNIKWAKAMGLPVTATIGRQDIIFGDGWLVLDGTPLDGSRTIFFDAARLTWHFEDIDSELDTIYIDQHADQDRWLKPMNDKDRHLIEQNERGAIAYFRNRSLENTELDAYFIYKHEDAVLSTGDNADIYTFGGRYGADWTDNWKYRAEMAGQFGRKNNRSLCALGFNSRLSYFFNDKYNNNLRLSYEYLSGDKPGTGTDEAFDPLWGRWPQFSELLIYTYAGETRIADVTNLHRLSFGWSINPTENLEFCTDYHVLFAGQNTLGGTTGFSESGNFRGQLLAGLMRYKFTEHIYGHLVTEFFFPGDYYDDTRNDAAVFLRYELSFRW